MPKRLKLTQKPYLGYTGQLGRYEFVDGLSVEAIHPHERVRMGAIFPVVEIDDEGTELDNPSPAHSVMINSETKARLGNVTTVQTGIEKTAENVQIAVGGAKLIKLYSRVALEALVAREGIAGLRAVAADWKGVRSKSIPDLIEQLLTAQEAYASQHIELFVSKGADRAEAEALLKFSDEPPAEESATLSADEIVKATKQTLGMVQTDKIVANTITPSEVGGGGIVTEVERAAITGDLGAALTADEPVADAEKPE